MKTCLWKAVALLTAMILMVSMATVNVLAEQAPTPLTVYRYNIQVDPEGDPIIAALEKATNTKLDIITAAMDQAWTKANLIMSSGEYCDLISLRPGQNNWEEWARDGLLVDLSSMDLSKYPYLEKVINADIYSGFKIDGKSYFIPGVHQGYDYALYIREDWLQKLGLQMPKTIEELYVVMKAFVEKDPDGNGIADTIAYQSAVEGSDNFQDMLGILTAFGAGGATTTHKGLILKDGKLVDRGAFEGTKAALLFLNKMYREGLINSDFATIQNGSAANDKYAHANKAGIVYTSAAMARGENARKIDPNASFAFVPPLSAEGFAFEPVHSASYHNLYAIPSVSKYPEKVLEFCEYLNSQPGKELIICGIKGRHYTELSPEGIFDRNKENWAADYDETAIGYSYPLWAGFTSTVFGYIPAKDYATFEEAYANEIIYINSEDAAKKFNTKTNIAYGKQYNGEPGPLELVNLTDAEAIRTNIHKNIKAVYWTKMILAASEEEAARLWDEYIAEYEKAGGLEMLRMYQEYYDANLKK